MSSGKSRKRVQELLEVPFRHKRPRSSSPSSASIPRPAFSNTPANTQTNTTIPGNVISGSLITASASTNVGIASSGTLAGPMYTTGYQALNPQPLVIPVLVKNEAFQQAIQEYINQLSDDDRLAFQSATDVMEKLEELQQRKPNTFTFHSTRIQKVQKVLQCLKQFMGSIAICIQHSPQISSLVVGGLNCILTVSTEY